jgi:hypothetical protein
MGIARDFLCAPDVSMRRAPPCHGGRAIGERRLSAGASIMPTELPLPSWQLSPEIRLRRI